VSAMWRKFVLPAFCLLLVLATTRPSKTTLAFVEGPTTGPLPSYAGYLFAIGAQLAIYLISVWWRRSRLYMAVRSGRWRFGEPVTELRVEMDGREVRVVLDRESDVLVRGVGTLRVEGGGLR
ncbi:MAG: hypothetical protein VB934_13635, partial [Polyangiaceae bacterium]